MHRLRRNQGIALITAIAFLVITLALVGTALVVTTTNLRLSRSNSQTIQTQMAAEAGLDVAIARVWHGAAVQIRAVKAKEKTDEGYTTAADVDDYRKIWDDAVKKLQLPKNLETGDVDTSADGFGTPVELEGEIQVDGSKVLYKATVERFDVSRSESFLRITSTGTVKNASGDIVSQRRLSQTLSVNRPPFEFDFAMISDFINCTFCHSAFTSIEAGYSSEAKNHVTNKKFAGFEHLNAIVPLTDKDKRKRAATGTRRIRVAGLREMNIINQLQHMNTLVGGTMYTRGRQNIMYQGAENQCPTRGPKTDKKCRLYLPYYKVVNGVTTDIIDSRDWTTITGVSNKANEHLFTCTVADTDNNKGCEEPRARFYENYPKPTEKVAAIDGKIPDVTTFPSPIKDKDGDHIISNEEWKATVSALKTASGKITGAAEAYLSVTDANGVPQDQGTMTTLTRVPINNNGVSSSDFQINTAAIATTGGTSYQNINLKLEKGVSNINANYSSQRGYKGNLILIGTKTNPITFRGRVFIDGDLVLGGYIDPGQKGMLLVRRNVYVIDDVLYDCNGRSGGTNCDYTDPDSLKGFSLVSAGSIIVGDPTATRHAGDFADVNGNGITNYNNGRWAFYPFQGELTAFNRNQHDLKKQDASYIPRYYVHRQGDLLAWRCLALECVDYTTASSDNTSVTGRHPKRMTRSIDKGVTYGDIEYNQPVNPNWPGKITYEDRSGATSIYLTNAVPTTNPNPPANPDRVVMALSPSNNWLTPVEGLIDTDKNGRYDDGDKSAYNRLNPTSSTSLGAVGDIGSRKSAAVLSLAPDGSGNVNFNATRYWDDLRGVSGIAYASSSSSPRGDKQIRSARHKQISEVRAIISESVIAQLWYEHGNKPRGDRTVNNPLPLQFDGMLYTNNALFNFQPKGGVTGGGWVVNGSIVAFEAGLLVYGRLDKAKCQNYRPNRGTQYIDVNLFASQENWLCVGLRVHYDQRLPKLLDNTVEEPVLTRLRSDYVPIK